LKKKINNSLDRNSKQIQTALLKAADPLCGLWSQLLEQGMENDMDIMPAPVSVQDVPGFSQQVTWIAGC